MCLAIPGQVVELVDDANQIATVDVVGVRRNINVSLLADDDGGADDASARAELLVEAAHLVLRVAPVRENCP